MTVTRSNKSANTTPKVAKVTPKATPKKNPTKKPATPTKSTPKKAATPKKTEELVPEATTVTPVTSAPSTPKTKKTSVKSTPVKATKKASTSKPTTPVKTSRAATLKKAAEPKETTKPAASTPKRKVAATTASPTKKAKSGAIPERAIKKPIPSDMIVQDHEAKEWNLHELVKKHGLIIFAYPAASTPGCTKQVCFFRDAFSTFADKGFKVFGLSNDAPKKNASFCIKQKLNYPLISDPSGKLISFLGIAKDASYKAQRSAFVIPQGGEIMYCNTPVGPEPSKDWAQSIVLGL